MKYDIVLLSSFSQVEDWRKHHASLERRGLFSQTVTTFNAWIADLWELHGDGRAIADSLQRQTIMQAAFDQDEEEADSSLVADLVAQGLVEDPSALTVSRGVVKLAARCVRDAAGVPSFDDAVAEAACGRELPELSLRECTFLQRIARYYGLLDRAGFIEVGQAASYLAEQSETVFPHGLRVLVANAEPPDWRLTAFFAACPMLQVDLEQVSGAEGVERMPDGVQVRFGFPSGRYAQPALVADLVRTYAADARAEGLTGEGAVTPTVVVACKDPLSLYKHMEPALVRDGIIGCVQAQVPFSTTDFGRQFLSLCRVLENESWSKEDLSDAALPPFSGFSKTEALQLDQALRADRLAQKDESLSLMRIASDMFSQLEELASDPEADVLLGVFEQAALASAGRSNAWRSEQLTAASAIRSCTSAARAVGASMRSCTRVLDEVGVTVSYETMGHGGALAPNAEHDASAFEPKAVSSEQPCRVVVTTQAVASQMGAGSCGWLILCDMTSEDYPIADKDDAAATLFAKLGLMPTDTMLARSRRTFSLLQSLPTESMVCLRPLNDWDGNPTYPSAMLQELIDAYRDDATSVDDLDSVYGLPHDLMATMVQRGEEALYSNASALEAGVRQPVECLVAKGSLGRIPEESIDKVALPRVLSQGQVNLGFSPSPSQVELYLECPYKWFAQRRLGIEMLDEGFGPLERGTFAHAVLQKFYQAFREQGFPKVTPGNLAQAKTLLRQVAEQEEVSERALNPGSGRCVAANQIEQRELDALKEQLVSYLDFEAGFLPTFRPAYFEYVIDSQAGIVYAGHPFIGTVDRIDVDDAGNAVIIDYKGSVGAAHEISGKGPLAPGKVQTRMYARAVERALGLRVVGALYVSYGKRLGCAGAFDGRVLEAGHLPKTRVDHCSCALESPADTSSIEDYSQLAFADMLDATEQLVAEAIESMKQGRVQPAPATPDSCQYCPVRACPQAINKKVS